MCPEERICWGPPSPHCVHTDTHTHTFIVLVCAQRRQMQHLLVPRSQFGQNLGCRLSKQEQSLTLVSPDCSAEFLLLAGWCQIHLSSRLGREQDM